MTDRFESRASAPEGPATHGFAITPDDETPLDETTRGIYVGGAGDLVVTLSSGVDVSFSSVPAGTVMPIRATSVKATGTTATNLVGLV